MDNEIEKIVNEIREDIKQIKSDVKNLTDETSKDYVQGLIDNVKEEEPQWTCNYCGGDMMLVEYDYIGVNGNHLACELRDEIAAEEAGVDVKASKESN